MIEKTLFSKVNGVPVFYYIIDGQPMFYYKNTFMAYLHLRSPSTNELLKIEKSEIKKGKYADKKDKTYISALGLYQWINHSIRFSAHEKRMYINELANAGFIDKSLPCFSTTKENTFFSNLIECLLTLSPKLEIIRQFGVGKYAVDCLLDGRFVIEFDENNHKSYNKELEKQREDFIINNGYKIIRVKDSDSIGKNIGLILKQIQI